MQRGDNDHSASDLEFAKARLTESLKRCRALVHECRYKLAGVAYRGDGERPMFRWRDKSGDGPGG